MDYAQQQRSPGRHLAGLGGVVLLHILIVYALVSGLARKVVDVVKGPIDVKVIEEQVQKPPPPPENLPPPPKLAAPPPPFIPPPEINIATPPPVQTITAVTQEAPPAPAAPVIAKVDPTPAPAPAVVQAQAVCPNYREVLSSVPYPREAQQAGTEGDVVVQFTIAANGQIRDAVIVSSSNRIFNRASLNVVLSRLSCQGQGRDFRASIPLSYRLKD
jgi:protein TonB